MPVFGDYLEKLSSYVKGLTAPISFSGTNPSAREPMMGRDGLPLSKEYVEQYSQENPSYQAPEGSFKPSTMDYYNDTKPNLITQYTDKSPLPENFFQPLMDSAQTYSLDPNLLASVIASESGGVNYNPGTNPGADGEIGIAQIIPEFHYKNAGFNSPQEYAQALQDPNFSIEQAASILRDLMDLYDENAYAALAAYNAGPTGYSQGGGTQYAEDTLKRVGLLDKYQQDQLAQGY
jgi:soluble lytic murein transglycosylase-like protein